MNKTVFQHINELILQDHSEFPGLIDLGSCTIHIIHNAFGKGIDQYGKDIDQLCMDLYFLFKHSSPRHEDFKVWWLSMGSSIKRVIEQWDTIIWFVAKLAKDPRKVPKNIIYKRVYMMLGPKEKLVTKVSLEFLNLIITVFEKFLLLFQESCPVVHILYGNLCDILIKLLRRFIKPQGLENKYGSDLASVDCTKFQLPDKEFVIGKSTRKVLKDLTADQQKITLLGMRSFFKATAPHLKENYL